jgi:hypothetical protein
MKIKNTISLMLLSMIFLLNCASDREISIYTRKDVDTSKSKILAFPMLLWDGSKIKESNTAYSNPLIDALFGKNWASDLGAENVIIIPKMALDKIPNVYTAMDAFIKAADGVSAVEQTNPNLTKVLDTLTKTFGDGAIAVALVTMDKKEYESSGEVQVNMGLFDTKKLTWKWITKVRHKNGVVPIPYEVIVKDLVTESYVYLKEKSDGKVR